MHIKYGAGSIMYRGCETKRHGVKMREEKMTIIMMMNIFVSAICTEYHAQGV